MKLSKNFSLHEFTKSNTAIRRGISNEPTAEHLENLKKLCDNILQPLRDHLGLSIRVNSGYRSELLNAAIDGSPTSDHCKGMAADIELWVEGKEDNKKLYDTIKELDLPFKQMIWEFGTDEQPNWIHVAYDENDIRKHCMKAYKHNGKTVYVTI